MTMTPTLPGSSRYLSNDDVRSTMKSAKALGMETHVKEVRTNHVQTIFKEPKTIFDEALAGRAAFA